MNNRCKWQRINLRIKWDYNWDGKLPYANFFIDLIIIDLLFGPVIKELNLNFSLWSFHRAAWKPEDPNEGHRLEFRFFIEPDSAQKILSTLKDNPSFSFIEEEYFDMKIMKEVEIEPIDKDNYSNNYKIEALGDEKWPIEIRKSWPYYMKGISEMFIKLIEEIKNKKSETIEKYDKDRKEEIENYYKEIREEIAERWRNGYSPFLHHLSTVFGYDPIDFNSNLFIL